MSGLTNEADGSAATQAGSHPYEMTVAGLSLTTNKNNVQPLLAAGGGLREVKVSLPKGVVIDRLVDGKMTDSRILMDTLGMMQQLGVVPRG